MGRELDGHRLDGLTATAGNVSALQVLDRNMLNRGAASTGHPSVLASRACGWPVVYYSPVSVAGNNQSCEKRSIALFLPSARPTFWGTPNNPRLPKRWGRFG